MRVAFVHQDPGIRPGGEKGAAVHVARLCEALARQGAEVVRIEEPDPNVAIARLEELGSLDAIHERFSLGTGPIAAWARSRGVPHGLEVNSPLDLEEARYRGSEVDEKRREAWRAAFSSARLVSVVSRPLLTYVEELGARVDATRVHSNGVDLDVFAPLDPSRRDAERAELALDPDDLALVFHGRLRPWHDLPLLARAIARSREAGARIVLVCVGKGEFAEACAGVLPEEALRIVGWCAQEDVARRVGACDVLALAHSSREAAWFSPLKLREAMAMGLVPVVPELGDLPLVVLGGHAGLLYAPGDEAALAASLQGLAADADGRQELAEAARTEAARHGWDWIARDVLERLGGEA